MRTSNPTLKDSSFQNLPTVTSPDEAMTLQGTVTKTAILLFLVVLPAMYIWNLSATGEMGSAGPWIIGGSVGGFILALVTVFRKQWSAITAPLYAICEGLAIGGISAVFEAAYPGIVFQAVSLTFGTLVVLLVAYTSGWIRPSENFKLGVVSATGAIALIYFVTFVLQMFGIRVGFINDGGILGIAFSLFVVAIAAMNLVLDFDFIEKASEQGVPKYMEWYGAFGLMVTLIWLYLEILRLLAKTRGRK